MSVTRARMAFAMNAPALQGAAAPAVPWVPTDLGATLKAWWSADDHGTARMTDDGAGVISSWTDKKGGMAIAATTTERPTWAAASFNSTYAGLTFDGVANAMASTSLTTLPTGSTAGSIFLVLSNTHATSGAKVALSYGGTTASTLRNVQKAFATVARLAVGDQAVTLTDTASTFTGPALALGSWAGTTMSSRLNGQDATPASATIATLASGAVRFRLGAFNGTSASLWFQGVFSDAIITTALTLTQMQQLEGWAAWAKGLTALLPAGHPYKSARP